MDIEKTTKLINKLFKQRKLKIVVDETIETETSYIFYLKYKGIICPKKVTPYLDDFAIAIGGRRMTFTPVVERKTTSYFEVFKFQEECPKKVEEPSVADLERLIKETYGLDENFRTRTSIESRLQKYIDHRNARYVELAKQKFGVNDYNAEQIVNILKKNKCLHLLSNHLDN